MADWVWFISYEHGDTRIVLADRSAIGCACDLVGSALLGMSARSWPWRLGLGSAAYRLGTRLIFAADRHQRTLVEIPADDAVIEKMQQLGLIDGDEPVAVAPESNAPARTPASTPTETPGGAGDAQEAPDGR